MAKDYMKQIGLQKAKIESLKQQRNEITRRIKNAESEIEDLEKAMVLDAVKAARKQGCETDTLLDAISNLTQTENSLSAPNKENEEDSSNGEWPEWND